MKFREYSSVLLCTIVLFALVRSANSEDYYYEYYYEDELTTTSRPIVTTTTRRPVTTTRNGKLVGTTTKRMNSQYQALRPDIIVNIITDMYGLQSMRLNSRPSRGYYYPVYSNRYSSRYESPFEYWYSIRQPNRPAGRPQSRPSMIDYYGGQDYEDYYSDYNYGSSSRNRVKSQRKGRNRAIFNFMLNALGSRRN